MPENNKKKKLTVEEQPTQSTKARKGGIVLREKTKKEHRKSYPFGVPVDH